ncbi:MAG TPA: hypothetical protein PLD27_12485 [bacterium]|nr:hypothetical protein [bacterium]HOL48580.1 hypothetical protein [bacterium]HPQ20067.1 hypothetical protein [bacterium]
MSFNSFTFLFFFLIIYIVHILLSKKYWKIEKYFLLLASYIFYGWWNPKYLLLIIISTIIDFYAGKFIFYSIDNKKRKYILIFSIICNLGLLFYFKYFNFFIENINNFLNFFHIKKRYDLLNIILPIGISFYTFQTMSYTIDIYRNKMKPIYSFSDFALFVSFFPQLVAGPIVRAKDFLKQLVIKKSFYKATFYWGFYLIILGYFKKVVIADNLANYVQIMFNNPIDYKKGLYYWLAIY